MSSRSAWLARLAGALGLGLSLAWTPGPAALRNGDVEQGSPAPTSWQPEPGPTLTGRETDPGRGLTLRVDGFDPHGETGGGWIQRVTLAGRRPARLELSADVRTEGLHPRARAFVEARLVGRYGEELGTTRSERVALDGPWRRVRAVFDLPPGCRTIEVRAKLIGRGRALFDALELRGSDRPALDPGWRGPQAGYRRLARGAAADLGWSFDASEARWRAAREGKPILVYVRCIDHDQALAAAQHTLDARGTPWSDDGLRKDVLVRAGPWSDPELAALVRRRFVPLLVTYDLSRHGMHDAPDDPLASVGLRAPDVVTPAICVLDAEGELVHALDRIGVLSARFLDAVLRGALGRCGGAPGPSDDPEESYLYGELERTLELLGQRADPAARVLRARTLARAGRPAEALAELGKLPQPEAELVRGRAHLARGATRSAASAFANAAAFGGGECRAEAVYFGALCAARLGRHGAAARQLDALVGPSRFGRRAAAWLVADGPRPALAGTELWSAEHVARAALAPGAGSELPASTEGLGGGVACAAGVVRFLLDVQEPDGSFPTHGARWRAGTTAVVVQALRAERPALHEPLARRADRALARAEAWLSRWLARPAARLDAFDLPYVLEALLACDRAADVERAIERSLDAQRADGSWSVYGPDRPTSFLTALHLIALVRARDGGFGVPEEAIERGAACLAAMRDVAGHFPYSPRAEDAWMTGPEASVARDAVCAHALARAAGFPERGVDRALTGFLEHAALLRGPTKKLYDWFDERGHGGYQFLFALRESARAARLAPYPLRDEVERRIARELAAARELDGTWMDHAMLGRAYGSAMALLALRGE